jgi:hypothetical protein
VEGLCARFSINLTLRAGNDQLGLHFTEANAIYMQAKFRQQLQGSDDHVTFPPDWDFTLLQECEQAFEIVVEAYHNPCSHHRYVWNI